MPGESSAGIPLGCGKKFFTCTVYANRFTAGIPGYGVRVAYVTIGTVVGCDTYVPASPDGISNKVCQK